MPTYNVFNLASATLCVAGDIHVAASTRLMNAAVTLPTMRRTRAFCAAGK